jgi:nitroimidazol reductase NimA-like FMN-containing flavoprotein (pyridoxamine 5'-phosphate oxidase superfamily)
MTNLDTAPMLTELDRDECWRLLGRTAVGRVAVIRGALPSILPVNVCAADDAVWFRVGPGVLLDAALNGDVVSVEADEVDRVAHGGWSVVVTGRAEVAADRDDLPVRAWGRPDADHLVRVPGSIVTGRRL